MSGLGNTTRLSEEVLFGHREMKPELFLNWSSDGRTQSECAYLSSYARPIVNT